MSAADAREQLEAAIRRAMTEARTCRSPGKCQCCEDRVTEALAAGDDYAIAYAHEVTDEREGRDRLEAATAERTGRTT